MLFQVRMQVNIPDSISTERVDQLKSNEKALALKLQQSGKWRHLWRVVGQYANISIFDVESNDELHQLLSTLPLYPFMQIDVTPLAQHPSALAAN
jgi:muconolactone D-isomerase